MARNETIVFDDTRDVNVESREMSEPAADEVLVRTDRTLISTGTELTILAGESDPGSNWAEITDYPFVPGYNNVGEVVEVGDAVETVEVGRRVATTGSHAAYTVAEESACRPIPPDVSTDEAVFFTIAEIVMNGLRRSELTWGETAAVYGLGLLGQLAVRLCHVAGARPVVGADLISERTEYLPDLPGVSGIDPSERSPQEFVRDATGERLADVVFEVTGNPDAIPDELDVLRDQGRFVVLSSPKGETTFDFHDHCNAPSYRIIGAHNSSHPSVATPQYPWTQRRHAELFFDYLAEGTLSVSPLISHREHYTEAPALYDELLANRSPAMGVVLEW
jgi:2-desacetyl-2-hydroxyethyl bacteriochlorophyllide A dehydrogenase